MRGFFLILWCMGTILLSGQNPKFYASTDAAILNASQKEYQVFKNSVFQVSFTLENAEGRGFVAPSFDGLQVISGPSTSTQVSIINGRKSQKMSYTYSLMGTSPGSYTIGSAAVKTSSITYNSDPFKVLIKEGSPTIDSENLTFVQAELSDSLVYLGQQLILEFKLYTQENIKSYDIINDYNFDGFYVEELNNTSRRTRRTIIEDKEYYVTVLESVALFPQQTGIYNIPSVSIRIGIPKQSRRRSLFSFQEYNYKIISTEEININVVELPMNAPYSFSGGVGQYSATFALDRFNINTDQSMTLRLDIRGNGDSKYLIPPILKLGDELEVYNPNTLKDEIYSDGSQIMDVKSYEYLIVPIEEGRFEINPEFTYFDPDSTEYISIYPQTPFVINVRKGQENIADVSSIIDRNLKPNKSVVRLTKPRYKFLGSPIYVSCVSFLSLFILGMFAHQFKLKRDASVDDETKAKRRARKVAENRLAVANDFIHKGEERLFYHEINKAIINYFEDKLTIATGSLSSEEILSMLHDKGVNIETIEKTKSLISNAEMSLFAAQQTGNMQDVYNSARNIIEEVEAQ